jgi:hypothetical protein
MNTSNSLFQNAEPDYGDKYNEHLFGQYKMYVELADRVSSRRMLANSFFLGLHTAIIGAIVMLVKEQTITSKVVILAPLFISIYLCYVWYKVIKSYCQLNSGKFKVIHEIEKKLPLTLFKYEWIKLGGGGDKKLYFPLSHIETLVPVGFAIFYILFIFLLWFFQ